MSDNGRDINFSIRRDGEGQFHFKTDDMGTIYDMHLFLLHSLAVLEQTIRQRENQILKANILEQLDNTGKGKSRLIDPFTRKPLRLVKNEKEAEETHEEGKT